MQSQLIRVKGIQSNVTKCVVAFDQDIPTGSTLSTRVSVTWGSVTLSTTELIGSLLHGDPKSRKIQRYRRRKHVSRKYQLRENLKLENLKHVNGRQA